MSDEFLNNRRYVLEHNDCSGCGGDGSRQCGEDDENKNHGSSYFIQIKERWWLHRTIAGFGIDDMVLDRNDP